VLVRLVDDHIQVVSLEHHVKDHRIPTVPNFHDLSIVRIAPCAARTPIFQELLHGIVPAGSIWGATEHLVRCWVIAFLQQGEKPVHGLFFEEGAEEKVPGDGYHSDNQSTNQNPIAPTFALCILDAVARKVIAHNALQEETPHGVEKFRVGLHLSKPGN